jgi:cell division protein FtsQ
MAKKVFVIIGLCILAGYLVFAAVYFDNKPKEQICSHFEIVSGDSEGGSLIETGEIEKLIDSKGLNPYGKPLKDINTFEIEKCIVANAMIKSSEVFVTGNGGIRAVVKSRQPVLRIISTSGTGYYIDRDGEKAPLSRSYVADLPLVSGAVTEDFAKKELLEFALFLEGDEFWNSQIEQIVVLPGGELKLIPAIGNHVILLGKPENYKNKLERLKTFYRKGLPMVGWNRYSAISLKYDNQVICTEQKK